MRVAIALAVALILIGAGLIVAGIQLLIGTPWALIAAGVCTSGAGFALRSRLVING